MKKFYIFLSVFALTVLVAGCAKELQDPNAAIDNVITVDETTGESIVTVTLSVPESSDTKTTLGDKDGSSYPVLWSAGDVITLNGTAATEFTPASGNATATAKFGKINNLASPYNFLYLGVAGQSNQVTFPASQSYVANGFDPAAMPMYASVTDLSSNITFSHVGALLKFSFTGTNKIDAITLTAADASKSLSGTFTIGATAGILNGSLTPAATGTSLTYDFGGHIQLSDDPFVFYVAIPAGTYEGGINLYIVDNASGHMNVTVMDSNSTKTIAAGKVREFDNVVYIPAKDNNLKQIYNDATFNEFVSAVAGGNKTLNARLTQAAQTLSLSASTISAFKSIEGYKGTFDGNNKTISGLTKPLFDDLQGVVKNLTLNSTIAATAADEYHWGIFAKQVIPSLEVDDVPGLQNCTAEGSITWTPSSAVSSMMTLGGLVGNNKGGTITGCTNNAAVTFANNGVSNTNQPSVGGVVGRTQKGGDLKTQGEISSCNNYGTVICAAQFSQNIYIGGVLGYQVEKAETMSDCVNHGLVEVASTASTGGALHLGGVGGLLKGVVENCTNASDGVVTSEACSVSTYLNQGGVVGRLNNDSGQTYGTLTNAGTLNVAANGGSSGRYIGGVAGRCNEGGVLDGVTNSGNINYTSVDTLATYIGGVVALNNKSGVSLENCNSTGGTLTYSGTTGHGPLYVGGVVGYSTQPVSSCTNAMTLNIGSSFSPTSNQYFSYGGIVGKMTGNDISGCLNTGNINYSQQISDNGYTFVGGVVGHIKGSIVDSSNGGTVTITGKNAAQDPFYGGVVGSTDSAVDHSITGKHSSASATNYGAVVINTTSQSNKYVRVGGVAGRLHTNGTMTATNNGPITITNLTCTHAYIGGLAGLTNAASCVVNSGSANLSGGTITVTSLTANGASSYCAFIGGVVGQAKAAVTATNAANISINGMTAKNRWSVGGVVGNNATSDAVVTGTNSGDIVISSGSTSNNNIFLGGVVGHGQGNITNSTNNGAVSNAAPVTGDGKYTQVGGIVGYNNGSSAISNCTNNGDITNSGTSKGYIYVGGITSETDAAITSCHNTGVVSNSGEALTQKTSEKVYQINVGGVAGHNGGATITSCYNTGAISNSADSGAGIMVGGVTGEAVGGTYVTCYNTGAISNTGFAYDSAERGDVALGGLVGFLNGDVTLTGTSAAYNYNNGPISEESTTAYVAMAGIAGIVKGNCELSFVKNLADGDLSCTGNTIKKLYMGGCVGVVQRLFTMNDASNAGDLNLRGLTVYNNSSSGVLVGGVIGAFSDAAEDTVEQNAETVTVKNAEFTFNRLTNSGAISCPNSGGNGGNLAAAGKSATAYSYFGGISGVGDTYSKNFYDCTNTANIEVYNQVKTRLGGILGYTNHNPTGCVCNISDKILYYRYNPQSNGGNGEIGGIVGYFNSDEFEDLTFIGGLQTTGSSPNCYTGGIIGRTRQSGTFLNCKVGKNNKNIVGASSGYFAPDKNNGAGLFTSCETNYDSFDFTGCYVATGTKCQGTSITADNLSSALIGRYQPTTITNLPTIGSW